MSCYEMGKQNVFSSISQKNMVPPITAFIILLKDKAIVTGHNQASNIA